MILIKNLYLRYIREYYALYDINIKINKNESVAFLGESESGKTSLLRILAKVERYSKGEIYIKNVSLNKINYATDVSLGYVPATPVFFENKTVYENLKYILKTQKVKKIEIESKINEVLIEFKLENIKETKVKELSQFEKFLISFARLAFRPLEIILIDDIFIGLKQEEQEILKDIIKNDYVGKSTLILATQDSKIAKELCKRKIIFKSGSIEND